MLFLQLYSSTEIVMLLIHELDSASTVAGTIKKCQPLLGHLLPMEFLV